LVALGIALPLPSALAIASRAGAQPLVRVRAETRIELAPRGEVDRLWVEGALRDDLGAPLPGRSVRLEIREGSLHGAVRTRVDVTTGIDGRFSSVFSMPPGHFVVVARFDGDEHLERADVFREILLDREHVRLDVEIEGGPTLDLDRPEHRITVRAHSDVGGADLTVVVTENGRELARGTTGAEGTARFVLRSADLGPPSAARLVVRSTADAHRADAQTEVPIVRFRATALTLESSASRLGPGETARLSGELRTRTGPLERRAVGLWAGDRHLATALTDGHGRFAVSLRWEDLRALDGPIVARFDADAPWWGSSVSPAVTLVIDPPDAPPWRWIAVSIAITAIAFALAGRWRRVTSSGRVTLPIPAPPIELAPRRSLRADVRRVAGRAVAARSETAIAGAAIRARQGDTVIAEASSDGSGAFSLSLPAGVYTLEFEARGYELARHRVVMPHRGEWSAIVVRLRSLRDLAWEPLQPIAVRVMANPDGWGVWTGRELERAARARAPAARSLSALIAAIERACYDREPPSADDLAQIRLQAEEVERDMIAALPRPEAEPHPAGGPRA
jgi:hypothetical protein